MSYMGIRSIGSGDDFITFFGNDNGPLRFSNEMQESSFTFRADFDHDMGKGLWMTDTTNDKRIKLKTGIYSEIKAREFNAREVSYEELALASSSSYDFVGENIALDDFASLVSNNDNYYLNDGVSTNGLVIQERNDARFNYSGNTNIMAAYVSFFIPMNIVDVNIGSRFERSTQSLEGFQDIAGTIPVMINNDYNNFLPYFNSTLHINEKNQLRMAFSKTLNRPELREMSPFAYFDFNLNQNIQGGIDVVQAEISNYDLRYEFYPTKADLIGVGVFYKSFDNPIELIRNTGNQFLFVNNKSAQSIGVEAELRKSLDFISESYLFNHTSVLVNGALIYSSTKLSNASNAKLNDLRPLQGQSPYMLNTGVYFKDDSLGLSVNINYNTYGTRLIIGEGPSIDNVPIYELSRHFLNMSVGYDITDNWTLTVSGNNLLNNARRLYSDGNFDDKIDLDSEHDNLFSEFREGQRIQIGLKYNF